MRWPPRISVTISHSGASRKPIIISAMAMTFMATRPVTPSRVAMLTTKAGPRIKAHFQPLRQGVGTGASNIRTGQQAVYPITNDRRQTNAPHPAKKTVLNGQARNNAGDTAGKRDPTNPGNTGEQTDLAAGQQIIGIGRNPAFGIPTQRPENSDQDENGQNGDKHGLPCPLASSISVPCPDSVSKPEDTRRTGFDALRLTCKFCALGCTIATDQILRL